MKIIFCFAFLIASLVFAFGRIPTFKFPTTVRMKFPNIRKTEVLDFDDQIGFLYSIKAQVLSGATNHQAIEHAVGILEQDALLETRSALQTRADLIPAMRSDSVTHNYSALADLALIMRVSEIAGAPVSAAISRVIHNLVATRTSKQLIAAELASTRATIFVLACLPLIGVGLAAVLGAAPLHWLLHSNIGRFFLMSGLGLEAIGLFWVNRITKRATLGHRSSKKHQDVISSDALVNVLENLSLCLAAGMNISNSVTEVSRNSSERVSADLNFVISKYDLGAPMNTCLAELGMTNPRWRSITDALAGALVSGGPIQTHLEDLLNSYRITAQMENLKRIRSIAVRAVAPLGLCFLPAFLMLSIAPMVVGLFSSTVW